MSGEVIARLFVAGRPRTKGHMTPGHIRGQGGRPCKVWLKDRDETKAWMKTLIRECVKQTRLGMPPYPDAVELHCFFRFGREEGWPSHDTPWPVAGDIGDEDTLRRAIGDALTQSGVIEDDRLIIGGMNLKRWCEPSEAPGVQVVLLTASSPALLLERERKIFRD